MLLFLLTTLFVDIYPVNENTEDIFNLGIVAYENKEYDESLKYFLRLENEDIINADLFYNIGSSYFRMGNLGKSILYYKKALKIKANHKSAGRDLEFVLSLTQDKQLDNKEDLFTQIWNKVFSQIDINLLAIILFLLFFIIVFLLNFILLKYQQRDRSIPLFFLSIFIIFFLLTCFFSYLKWKDYQNINEAVLLSQSAIGYSGPDQGFTRVFTIHEGMVFSVEKKEDNWSLIKLPNGLGGWIKTDQFETIDFR